MKKEISSKATALSMNEEGVVFVAGDSEVYRLSADSKEIKSEPLRDQAVCALAHAGGVVICSPEGASSYFVNDGE